MEPPSLLTIFFTVISTADVATLTTQVATLPDFDEVVLYLIIILIGLIFSAFFSSSEVAFFSQENKIRFEDGDKNLDNTEMRVQSMLDHPRRLLATILIGNTFANIIVAVFAAVLAGKFIAHFGVSEWVVYLIEILVITFIIVVLTEITPKIFALNNPIQVSRRLSRLLKFFFIILKPFASIIAKTTHRFEKYMPAPPDQISSKDIKTIAEVGELQGTLRGEEREIIENVIDFGTTMVKEIMTSRVNITAISTEDGLEDVIKLIKEKSTSRFPLYENDLDNIVGIIHAKDLLPFVKKNNQNPDINWKLNARKPFFIPATKKIDDLLKDFQREKTHIAIVVDEYGGTEGLVTLDDVLEEIIGEIHDEYTESESLFTRRKNGDYIFDAKIDLDEVGDILGLELTTDEDEYETLGGLVYHLMERIPEEKEKVNFKNLELTVEKIENNRLKKVKVKVLDPEDDTTDEQAKDSD